MGDERTTHRDGLFKNLDSLDLFTSETEVDYAGAAKQELSPVIGIGAGFHLRIIDNHRVEIVMHRCIRMSHYQGAFGQYLTSHGSFAFNEG